MRRNEKSWDELDELLEPFLPEEHIEAAATTTVEFRNRLAKLEQQVLSQYSAMAAYATIAKQDTDHVRAEARADLDRSQATVIGLIEKLRNEMNLRLDRLEQRVGAGGLSDDGATRLTGIEHHLASMAAALEQCIREPRASHPGRHARRAADAPGRLAGQCRNGRGSLAALIAADNID
jgi:hypothetical protein